MTVTARTIASATAPADRRRQLRLGLLATAGVVVFVATVLLAAQVSRAQRESYGMSLSPGWDSGLNGLVLLALGLVVVRRLPGHAVGRVMVLFGLFWLLVGFCDAYDGWALRDAPPPAVGAQLALWFSGRFGSFLLVGVPLLLLLYPTGRFLAGAWGVVSRLAVAVVVLWATAVVLLPGSLNGDPTGAAGLSYDAGTLPVDPGVGDAVTGVLGVLALCGGLASVVVVWRRHRRSTGLERRRIRWLLWAASAVVVLFVAASLVPLSTRAQDVLFAVGVLLPAVAVTIGLVQPDLVGVDELLSGTLLNGVAAMAVVAVDLAVLALLTDGLGVRLDQRTEVVLVLGLGAVVYLALRHLLVGRVRRLVFGTRDNPYDAVAGLASRLESAADARGQLAAVADAVAGAFGVRYVRVEVDRPGGRLSATHGSEPAATRTLPITFREATIGRLVVPRDGVRARLSARDEALLGDLVRQAALAARSARLTEELQDSRERLVLAREEERRRVRRDLHDGLGPALSGVVFRIETARLVLSHDPLAASQSLDVAVSQVQDVVADVRRLVHDLRPPALDDLGLVGALRQQATSLSAQGFTVRVEADGVDALPAAVEVAAYRVVGEAVTNAARHARATRCDVCLEATAGELHLRVSDDGTGVDPGAVAGVGLVSLRERVAELGGHAEVVCPPEGGTVVRARLPLRSAP
ncbi:sensor histidine kinase [Phycicoccus sp. M110.8]|uniref:sensor histidine kinase n=1 Tax=Phycicoccus sp. M110.8 TaxID=3075433 RepID=UPI0028FD2B87|nr:sensor histidine kinase [Phycicoccus sp. M110.8]MDU0315747.1 sensor histidine kinase [Phycicoccus sp. M110.8]